MKVRKYTSFHKDFIWNKSYLPSCMLAINFQMEIKIWGHRNSQILIKPTYKEIFRSGHPLWCGKYITGAHKKKKRKKRRLLIWKWNSMKNWEVYTVCCEITGKWRPNGFQVGTVFYEHFSKTGTNVMLIEVLPAVSQPQKKPNINGKFQIVSEIFEKPTRNNFQTNMSSCKIFTAKCNIILFLSTLILWPKNIVFCF